MIDKSEYAPTLKAVQRDLTAGASVDDVLITLKGVGFSQVDCIRAVVDLGLCDLGDAKRLVHFSRAWEPERERNEQFHADLEKAFREMPEL
jgi:hypothetical protein